MTNIVIIYFRNAPVDGFFGGAVGDDGRATDADRGGHCEDTRSKAEGEGGWKKGEEDYDFRKKVVKFVSATCMSAEFSLIIGSLILIGDGDIGDIDMRCGCELIKALRRRRKRRVVEETDPNIPKWIQEP